MSESGDTRVYVCPRCVTPYGEPGTCLTCHVELVECRPGPEGDPLRKPLMTGDGKLLTHAPGWWVRRTAAGLFERRVKK